jgi:hypothetical protein
MSTTAADLELAATWLEEYNDGDTLDPNGDHDEAAEVMFRVAAWLRKEAARREEASQVRAVAKQYGVSEARARAAIRFRQAPTQEQA